jgi:glycine cleavage system H protein
MTDTAEIKGCVIRKDLYYRVADHTWVKVEDGGTVVVGMTDVAQNMAGELLHAKVKKAGTVREKGRPIATVESSKWVGPVKTPVSGEIIEVNEKVQQDATLINKSPYDEGWLVRIKPSALEADLSEMATGDAAVEAYRRKFETENLKACKEVEAV